VRLVTNEDVALVAVNELANKVVTINEVVVITGGRGVPPKLVKR
jgi:hypothetical protein